jgi:hypothetical protein
MYLSYDKYFNIIDILHFFNLKSVVIVEIQIFESYILSLNIFLSSHLFPWMSFMDEISKRRR